MYKVVIPMLGLITVLVLAACASAVAPIEGPAAQTEESAPAGGVPSAGVPTATAVATQSDVGQGVGGEEAPTESGADQEGATAAVTSPCSFAGETPAPEFPAGLDWLNTERPLTLDQLKGKVVVLPPDADRSVVAPQFPLELDATFNKGQGTLVSDLTIFYCEAEAESICLIEQVRLEAPLEVDAGGDQVLKLSHKIELPEFGNP